jgi:UPF0755 protein
VKIRVLLLGFLSVLVLVAAAGSYAFLRVVPRGSFSQPVIVDIQPGTSSREIAARLEREGLIASRWLFLALRLVRGRAPLQAGEYGFEQPLSAWDAFERIASGRVMFHPVTLPEGFNRFEVAAAVAATGLVTRENFLSETEKPGRLDGRFPSARNLEGFLFPDTYYLTRQMTPAQVVAMMVDRFDDVFQRALENKTSPLDSYDLVKLASLIEKETPLPSEHGIISSVFHNRLRRGMLLQCDPTVVYGLVLEDRYRGRLLLADLAIPHPYNTYVHSGLPPGPIGNPGSEALHAAAHPAETGYLYFVVAADGSAGHVFSETLDEHNRAVAQYRRSRKR